MKRIMIVIGTRPKLIKMEPVVIALLLCCFMKLIGLFKIAKYTA